METQTLSERTLNLARQQGTLRSSDLKAAGIPRVVLTRLTQANLLEKIGSGLYRLPNALCSEHEGMATVALKAPQAVFCLLSALQFHELTTQLPREQWIALPRGIQAPRLQHPPIKRMQFTGKAYSEGIAIHCIDQTPIKIYSIAKTIADCFKYRNKIGIDVALEALKDARKQNKVSMDELWHFAKICRVTNVMRPYLEATE